VDAVLESVDVGRCPAVNLWFRAREMRMRAGQKAHPNDADDWVSLPLVPYVDIMLTPDFPDGTALRV
jgi:hypothetical protein